MTREDIITRQAQVDLEIKEYLLGDKYSRKHFKALCREASNLQRELDKLDGKTYVSDKWITSYHGESYTSLKDARMDLINKIKDLPGVEVEENKTGVVGVTVYTEYKVYYYIIHAHYRCEAIPESKRITKDLFGDDREEYDYRTIYVASIHTGSPWTWRYG